MHAMVLLDVGNGCNFPENFKPRNCPTYLGNVNWMHVDNWLLMLLRFWITTLFSFFSIQYPRCSMYGIFTYISPKLMVNVGKYSIHGSYGYSRNVPTEWTFYDQKKTTYSTGKEVPTTAAQETLTKSI